MAQLRNLANVSSLSLRFGATTNFALKLHTTPNTNTHNYDLVIVGGGIVGCASAREIQMRNPKMKIAILEKESKLAAHQSGHNSGVIHAGIYYKPGSLKARLCVEGMHLAYKYLDEKRIPYKKCGKLIVATDDLETSRLMDLWKRAQENKVPGIQIIEGNKIKDIEPYCNGIKAIHSPYTGIVDWALVTEHYGMDFKSIGGKIFTGFKVEKFTENSDNAEYPVTIHGNKAGYKVQTRYVLTCAGLQSDKVAELTGCPTDPRIIPFRGEYLLLCPEKSHMVHGNIYPVPDPRFPFLGVHFTPRMDGSVWLGPNAVLAFKREGYRWGDINPFELANALLYPGFIKMASKYIGFGLKEVAKSAFIPLQMKDLQKYIPDILEYDVSRGPAGVRAQALDADGDLIDDFVFHKGEGKDAIATRVLHCRNAPSPGATSSLAIAKMIADKMEKEFNFASC